jgi:hypothetical protein
MPYKDPEKRREAVRKSCKKKYWKDPEASRAKALAKYNQDRVKNAKRQKQRYWENPEERRAYQRAWYKTHKESRTLTGRKSMLKKHGMTIEDYDRMFIEQSGLCKVCGRPESLIKSILFSNKQRKNSVTLRLVL